MTQQPTSDAIYTPGSRGREVVAGSKVVVEFHTRGIQGEFELAGTDSPSLAPAVAEAIEIIRGTHPDVTFHLAADHPIDHLDPLAEAVADAASLPHRRDLLQLRRTLPVESDHRARATAPAITVRPADFHDDGLPDVGAWLRVNNRAFSTHPDQGAETVETLLRRLDDDPGDPAGFLVADDADRPGEFSGFCWTKVHAATSTDPALGEIHVIGVDPSHRGEGLGPSFVLAGLDHLAALGLETANLYVDADNAPARRLYELLDFTTYKRRRVYTS